MIAIHIYHHLAVDRPEVPAWARELREILGLILEKQEDNMSKITEELDKIAVAVAANTTRIGSLAALLAGLRQQIADALASETVSPEAQAKLDEIFATMTTDAAAFDTALNSNVPPPAPMARR